MFQTLLITITFALCGAQIPSFKQEFIYEDELKCSICRVVVDEISYRFETVNPKSKIETGMSGIDPKGNYKQKKIPYILSDSHITEILDQICDNSWHYVQMGYDPINKLPLIQRMNSLRGDPVNLDGSKMNIQDKEVTPDKIKRACFSFVEKYEDDVVEEFVKLVQSKSFVEKRKSPLKKALKRLCNDKDFCSVDFHKKISKAEL